MITPANGYSSPTSVTVKPGEGNPDSSSIVTGRSSDEIPRISPVALKQLPHTPDSPTAGAFRSPTPHIEGEVTVATPYTADRSVANWASQAATQRLLWHRAADGLRCITVDPAVRDGRPMIRDTRIALSQVLDTLADVGSVGAVVGQFPGELAAEAVEEALVFVARLAR